MTTTIRNHQLDGVRGIAAVAVIFYHTILHGDPTLVERLLYVPVGDLTTGRDFITRLFLIVFNGEAAVMIFFVLSGYVLHQSLRREPDDAVTIISARFIIHRLFRILPAVIVCMLAAYSLSKLFEFAGLAGYPAITFDQLWRNALLLQITIHGPSGSVQTELAAIPILLGCFFIARRFGTFALLLCFLLTIIQVQNPVLLLRYANLWPNACAFVGGMLLALPGSKLHFARGGTGTLIACAAFFMLCRHIVPGQSIAALIAQTISCVVVLGLIAHSNEAIINSMLKSKSVQFLGRVSFSLYLLNVVVLFCLWSIPGLAGPTLYAAENGVLVGVMALFLTLPLAYASERWIEQPGIEWGRRFVAWAELGPAPISAVPAQPSG